MIMVSGGKDFTARRKRMEVLSKNPKISIVAGVTH